MIQVTPKVYQLHELMRRMDKDELSTMLSDFRCSRNRDSEYFLKKIALRHEAMDISRTYLIVDLTDGKIKGYFTLALKCLNVDDPNLDAEVIKLMNLKDNIAQAYLIGQLARSDDAEPGLGKNMLVRATNMFSKGKGMFGCRTVRLDCKDELIRYYGSCGFRHIRKIMKRTSTRW